MRPSSFKALAETPSIGKGFLLPERISAPAILQLKSKPNEVGSI